MIQQPDLGLRITALRKAQQLTQEELSEKSHVSVRTIQRIEAGEVMPRMATIKILLTALGEAPETFVPEQPTMKTQPFATLRGKNTLLAATVAGAVYLVTEIVLSALDIAWMMRENNWGVEINLVYTSLSVVMAVAYFLFVRGFIMLGYVFENSLLRIGGWLMITVVTATAVMDVVTLFSSDRDALGLPYATAAIISGTLTIIFGVALLRLQDGMGELSRVAGLLEIFMGCTLVTVVFFFVSYIVMIPAVIIEILVLYRGYEYLSRVHTPVTT